MPATLPATFDVLWLSRADIDTLGITMAEIMDEVEAGFAAMGRGEVEMPAKIGIHTRKDCFIHAMPCYVGGAHDMAGMKCVSGYPPNQKKACPTSPASGRSSTQKQGWCVRLWMQPG